MTLKVNHSVITGAAPNPSALVDGPAWDADHTIAGSVDATQMPALTGDVTSSAGSVATTIAANAVTNAKLATMAAYTIKVNATGSTAAPTDTTIAALTTKATPAGSDYVMISDQAASGALKKAAVSTIGGVTSVNGQSGALAIPVLPGGRLTLTSGTPVMTTSVAGATTVYYTAYAGSYVPLYDGTNFVPTLIPSNEISLVTTDATKSPAAVAATSYYDVFVWNDSGTIRVSRGPAWTNSTTRSAGTALTLVNGIYLNNASITNGPAASRGTYVGTIGSNGTSTIDYIFPAVSTNGTAGLFNVWNCYNRVDVSGFVGMSAVQWTYAVANTWRQQNAQASYNIAILRGLNEDGVSLTLTSQCQPASATNAAIGIGLDSTTAATGRPNYVQSSVTQVLPIYSAYDGYPGLGLHQFNALEYNTSTTASTFYGSGGTSYLQTGLGIRFRA